MRCISRNRWINPARKIFTWAALLKNGDWLLIYQQDSADAFSKLNQTQAFSIIIFILGGIGIVTMAFILSGRMVNRFAVADSEKEMLNQQVIETGKLASVGELAAGIAHEINNPVAIMVEEAGWIQDLLEEEEFQASENFSEFKRAWTRSRPRGPAARTLLINSSVLPGKRIPGFRMFRSMT